MGPRHSGPHAASSRGSVAPSSLASDVSPGFGRPLSVSHRSSKTARDQHGPHGPASTSLHRGAASSDRDSTSSGAVRTLEVPADLASLILASAAFPLRLGRLDLRRCNKNGGNGANDEDSGCHLTDRKHVPEALANGTCLATTKAWHPNPGAQFPQFCSRLLSTALPSD